MEMIKYVDKAGVWKRTDNLLEDKSDLFQVHTGRYIATFNKSKEGKAGGYESVYLQVLDNDSIMKPEDYTFIDNMKGEFLPAKQRMLQQRNIKNLAQTIEEDGKIGIASGFKPSGPYHFGHKLTAEALKFFQENGAHIYVPVADMEASLGGIPKDKYEYYESDNLLDWGACGVDLDACMVYLQSEETRVYELVQTLSKGLSFDLVTDIYGAEKVVEDLPFIIAGVTQCGDILLGEHPVFNDDLSLLVSGPDQDGHMKMTTKLYEKTKGQLPKKEYERKSPAAIYIPHVRGLTGDKASSSKPNSTIYLAGGKERLVLEERLNEVESKLKNAEANTPEYLAKCALDMIRYINDFNIHNKVNFTSLVEKVPSDVKDIDKYLIDKCLEQNQDNVEIVKKVLPDAVKEHQKKRETIFKYALKLASKDEANTEVANMSKEFMKKNYSNIDIDSIEKPAFWNAPEEAFVDANKRNKTKWYTMIARKADEVVI